MRYQKSVDIWELPREQWGTLQRGQWVHCTGHERDKGVWIGVSRAGNAWVSWKRTREQVRKMTATIKGV